ncbi:fimbrial protein [Erwinia sp. PsM31]|uniref:fimbrial protein n=1 Tax=Erwinia sp. PsM31 TaxID=3030535 RepID=UPI00263B94C4|nr:fimbrial protein [Erwinia sp. PsM31]MDN4625489.1 fimbrial protein [Erwinia sp. PsM31]
MKSRLIQKYCRSAPLFALLAIAMVWSQQAFALSCRLLEGYGVMNFTLPLQSSNLTIGPGVSNGTVIYRQYFKPSRPTNIYCDNTQSYQPTINWYYSNTTPNKESDWSDSSFRAGKVYETGVAGIGIAIYTYNLTYYTVPFSYQPWRRETQYDSNVWNAEGGFEFDVVLIKTGAITPGTLIGSQLPTVKYDFEAPGISAINLGSLNFSGAINIVSQTCQTPDVTVEMGKYDIAEYFTGTGKTTEWKDATINLVNCPRFYGTLNDGRNTWTSDNGASGMGAITNNILNLTLSPNTAIIDSANGILGIKTGSGSATGVGIQMAYGNKSDASPLLVDFASSKDYSMQNSAATTQSMPLVARYIQTESTVSAGRADATVTFTINYY